MSKTIDEYLTQSYSPFLVIWGGMVVDDKSQRRPTLCITSLNGSSCLLVKCLDRRSKPAKEGRQCLPYNSLEFLSSPLSRLALCWRTWPTHWRTVAVETTKLTRDLLFKNETFALQSFPPTSFLFYFVVPNPSLPSYKSFLHNSTTTDFDADFWLGWWIFQARVRHIAWSVPII